jgi:hypothetical protein
VLLSFAIMAHDTAMLHIYGWRRGDGPYFLGNPSTVDEGIILAEDILKDRRRGFMRAVVKDVRAGEVLWHSAPVLRPGGTR